MSILGLGAKSAYIGQVRAAGSSEAGHGVDEEPVTSWGSVV